MLSDEIKQQRKWGNDSTESETKESSEMEEERREDGVLWRVNEKKKWRE